MPHGKVGLNFAQRVFSCKAFPNTKATRKRWMGKAERVLTKKEKKNCQATLSESALHQRNYQE